MKTLNKRGPSIDPCGTPLWMSAQLLRTLLTFICCFLFDKYEFSNETELSETPQADNLSSSMACGRQSKAFERSIRTDAI